MGHRLRIPEPLTTVEIGMSDGARVLLRRHGNAAGPRLVLSHGNGFAIDLYYPFWSLLADRFDLVLYDIRNHGRNPPCGIQNQSIATFVSDSERILEGIDRSFGEKPRIGVFHSLSAVVALNHEPPGKGFAGLVLFDAPIYPTGGELLDLDRFWKVCAERARERRSRYETLEEFVDSLRRSPAFAGLAPEVLNLFAQATLRRASDGNGYEVRCSRECEARIYEHAFAYNFEPGADEISCPVKMIGADPTLPFSFLPSMDLRGLVDLDYDFVPEATHWLQIEKPRECIAMMLEFLKRHALV